MDDFFHCDFLLTYRSFLPSAQPIIDTVKTMWEEGKPRQRERVGRRGYGMYMKCLVLNKLFMAFMCTCIGKYYGRK